MGGCATHLKDGGCFAWVKKEKAKDSRPWRVQLEERYRDMARQFKASGGLNAEAVSHIISCPLWIDHHLQITKLAYKPGGDGAIAPGFAFSGRSLVMPLWRHRKLVDDLHEAAKEIGSCLCQSRARTSGHKNVWFTERDVYHISVVENAPFHEKMAEGQLLRETLAFEKLARGWNSVRLEVDRVVMTSSGVILAMFLPCRDQQGKGVDTFREEWKKIRPAEFPNSKDWAPDILHCSLGRASFAYEEPVEPGYLELVQEVCEKHTQKIRREHGAIDLHSLWYVFNTRPTMSKSAARRHAGRKLRASASRWKPVWERAVTQLSETELLAIHLGPDATLGPRPQRNNHM